MESPTEKIRKIEEETAEEARRGRRRRAGLISEVDLGEGGLGEEREDETVLVYEAVAKKYRELYEGFKLKEYLHGDERKKALVELGDYLNSELSLFKNVRRVPSSASISRVISVAHSIPEIKGLFTQMEVEDWIVQMGKPGLLQELKENMKENLSRGKKDFMVASWAIYSLSAIFSTPEIKRLFTQEEIKDYMVQMADSNFLQK